MVEPQCGNSSFPRALSAKFRSDFAFPTFKDRVPIIITKTVDTVYRLKETVENDLGEDGLTDLKNIVGALSKLKNEVQTNKPITDLPDDGIGDEALWNNFLRSDRELQQSQGATSAWFVSPWLLAECYLYRRIASAVRLSNLLKTLDPFASQKKESFTQSLPSISALAGQLLSWQSSSDASAADIFSKLFHVALWGNRCDLSISAGAMNAETDTDPVGQAASFQPNVLYDDTDLVWDHLESMQKPCRVDFILDNAGFELFTDLCLADFLTSSHIASCVRFHAKCIPWFVSDVTEEDWNWTLQQLSVADSDSASSLRDLGNRWKTYLKDGTWQFTSHQFWTLPCDFTVMHSVAPDLYADLAGSDLLLFKGDLNYRKLIGDLHWSPTVTFRRALRGFVPAPLCCLRTLKCDVVVGLADGKAEAAELQSSRWMLSGDFSVVQCLLSAVE